MDITSLIIFLVIGAVAGWLAGAVIRGGGSGLVVNILVGIIGGIIGGFLFRLLAIAAGGWIGSTVTAAVGAIALLYAIKLLKNRQWSST